MITSVYGFTFTPSMHNIRKWSYLSIFLLLISCERAIHFEPRSTESKLVVEGIIENEQYPIVYLSNSLGFFNTITPADLANFFVHDAKVTISNGSLTHILKEKTIPVANGANMYYYAIDSADLNTAFKGELGTKYDLTIEVGGQTYTSSTTIPPLTQLITALWYEEYIDREDSGKVALYGEYYDPPGLGNYTRYFTQVGEGPFLPGLNSIFDDQVVDGKTYSLQIDQGVDRNTDIDFEEYSFFRRGDSVTVKHCNIDKGVYDFWRTMEFGYQSIGNPFSSPTKVTGNISNGALGYFGGYAVQYIGISLPE